MKPSKKSLSNQRKLIEQKIAQWVPLRNDRTPPSGWLKAMRGALGISTRQLASRLGVEQAAIVQFEQREAKGKVSLESIQKVARAMRCQLVYAIVPTEPFDNLEAIVNDQAIQAAREVVTKADHTMRLEKQGITPERSNEQVRELAMQLKDKMDASLWGTQAAILQRKKAK